MSEDKLVALGGEDPPPAHLDPAYQTGEGTVPGVAPAPPVPSPSDEGALAPDPEVVAPVTPGDVADDDVADAPQRPDPDETFGKGSGVDLVPVSRDMAALKEAAQEGKLRLDEETADALLKDLADIKEKVDKVLSEARELDVPLKLGANWVAETMSKRLHAVADGTDSAAIRVLKQFAMVIADYEAAVGAATRRYYTTEEELQTAMRDMQRKVADEGSRA